MFKKIVPTTVMLLLFAWHSMAVDCEGMDKCVDEKTCINFVNCPGFDVSYSQQVELFARNEIKRPGKKRVIVRTGVLEVKDHAPSGY